MALYAHGIWVISMFHLTSVPELVYITGWNIPAFGTTSTNTAIIVKKILLFEIKKFCAVLLICEKKNYKYLVGLLKNYK